jgi:hypothetical protein
MSALGTWEGEAPAEPQFWEGEPPAEPRFWEGEAPAEPQFIAPGKASLPPSQLL